MREHNTGQNLFSQIKDEAENLDRTEDKGLVNEKTGSSISLRKNGDISIAANKNAQYKLNYDSNSSTEVTMQSTTITNRKNIVADEIVVNKHKLNPQLYELSDMRTEENKEQFLIGNIMLTGTVLVRAWEPNLKRYVLIRRQIRLPAFSQTLNVPDAPDGLAFEEPESISSLGEEN